MMAIAKYLPQDEFDLTICSLRSRGYKEMEPVFGNFGVRCMVAQFRPKGQSWKYIPHLLPSIRDQALIDQSGPFDIQHSLDYVSIPFEAFMARMKSRRYVYNQANMNELGNQTFLRVKIRLADRIIAISDSTMELLAKSGASSEKLRKVYLGIDTQDVDRLMDPYYQNRDGAILSVGRIIRRKRHEDAIRAFSVLAREIRHLRLRIAGSIVDEKYFQELKRLVSDLGLSERVEFLGLRDDVPQLMQQSHALVHCAESEGFGWVVVEAMTVGLPVIASAADGPRDIINDQQTGLLVPTGNVSAYAEALRKVLYQPAFCRELSANARASVEKEFSAEKMVIKIADIYRELMRA
jgi:glycosyltransferase involved in cell wall biosynthesis